MRTTCVNCGKKVTIENAEPEYGMWCVECYARYAAKHLGKRKPTRKEVREHGKEVMDTLIGAVGGKGKVCINATIPGATSTKGGE